MAMNGSLVYLTISVVDSAGSGGGVTAAQMTSPNAVAVAAAPVHSFQWLMFPSPPDVIPTTKYVLAV
jgi:hypothetical protein